MIVKRTKTVNAETVCGRAACAGKTPGMLLKRMFLAVATALAMAAQAAEVTGDMALAAARAWAARNGSLSGEAGAPVSVKERRDGDGSKIKATTKVTKSVTYYARWTANKYKIKFDKSGGKGTMKTLSATYGKSIRLTANAFKRSKYKFTGWAKKKGGKVAYKNKAKVKNLTSKNGKTVTLYAVWKKSK